VAFARIDNVIIFLSVRGKDFWFHNTFSMKRMTAVILCGDRRQSPNYGGKPDQSMGSLPGQTRESNTKNLKPIPSVEKDRTQGVNDQVGTDAQD